MRYELNYQVAWVQDISGSAVVPAGPAAHKAMLWRPAGDVNAVITGGRDNRINNGAAESFIGGGHNNTVNAPCAAILGGQGNTVNHAYAGVFGNGVTSQAPDTFHVSCLNAVNTPIRPGGGPVLPSGTIFRYNAALGPVPAGALPLYIMP